MQTTTTTIPVIQHWGTALPAPTDTFSARSLTDDDVLTAHEVMGGMSAQSVPPRTLDADAMLTS